MRVLALLAVMKLVQIEHFYSHRISLTQMEKHEAITGSDVRDRGFQKLLYVDDAWEKFVNSISIKPLPPENVPLSPHLINRVLANDVVSPINIPPFARAAMDGYAVRAEDTFGASNSNPKRLQIVGTVDIGDVPTLQVTSGTAVKITTGAPMPMGADAVVMVEDTETQDSFVNILAPVTPGKNLAKQGEDVRKGDTVLRKGTILRPPDLALLKAIGVQEISVIRAPRIAVLSTGDELVDNAQELSPAKIIDSNRIMIQSQIIEDGGIPVDFGIARDNPEELEAKLKRALEECDAVLVSGGTSVGPKDYLPRILSHLGEPGLIVHGVAISPGRPVGLGAVNGKPVILLPGYPVAAFLNYELFAYPLLKLLQGVNYSKRPREKIHARINRRVSSKPGQKDFIRVTLSGQANDLSATIITRRGAGILSSLTRADALLIIPEDEEGIEEGSEVELELIRYF